MDKDVKRALILWPAIASTAIVTATTLPLLWDADAQPNRYPHATAGPSALTRWVELAHHWMTPEAGTSAGSEQMPPCDQFAGDRHADGSIADSPFARSLRGAAPAHRPDRGQRGLAMPERFASQGNQGDEEGGRGISSAEASATADSAASSRAIAQTLLAPVLDPVAELAGYSGLTSPLPAAMSSDATPLAHPALPSIFSPGMDNPFSATGMLSRNPIASWNAIAAHEEAANQQRGSHSLIPQSVAVLAKPSRTHADTPTRPVLLNRMDSVTVGSPVTWPHPQQLCRDLAVIAGEADIMRVLGSEHGATTLATVDLGSTQVNAGNQSLLRDLVAGGNRRESDNQAAMALQRQASAMVMGRWAEKVERTLAELRSLPRIGDERSGELIRTLAALSEAGLQLAERVPARDQQVRWLQASHALSRRAAVWGPIWQLARVSGDQTLPTHSEGADSMHETRVPGANLFGEGNDYSLARFQTAAPGIRMHAGKLIVKLRRELEQTGDADGWAAFLLLDEIEDALAGVDVDARALVAQRFLSRLDHHSLVGEHREWLQRDSVLSLASAMQTWTAQPIDYTRLLGDLERGETDAIDLSAIKVSEAFQSLRFSNDVDAARVAKAIDVTYRNANVRTAISLDLIERLLPPVVPRTEPIHTNVLGNEVRGTSTIHSQLGLQLQTASDSWNLAIMTHGTVATNSRSGRSGVSVLSGGRNDFHATTPLIIRPEGYQIGRTRIDVSGTQQLRGIRTPYDRWPLVGSLVRGIAEARFDEARPAAERISNDRIRDEVTQELQTQLAEKTRAADARLDEIVFGPLGRLNLEPKVIDLQTTPRRLVARYRIAGDWQLASNTPRPRAWSDSWMSLQIHQSALNNTMERLLPTGRAKSVQDFYRDTMELFGREAGELPSEVPADAMIEFAATRPITVEIKDGQLWLTIRVVSLSQADGGELTRFIVRGVYRPEINGLDAHLVRDGHLSISGPGMSMRQRIPLRALFNKILSENRTIPITMPGLIEHPAAQGLAISQFELRDGWIALAVSPDTGNRVAVGTRSAVVR